MTTTRIALVALVLLSSLPAAAGEHYRQDHRYQGEVLNGRLHMGGFDGGVGENASYGSDCCYGGGYYTASAGQPNYANSASYNGNTAMNGNTSYLNGYSGN